MMANMPLLDTSIILTRRETPRYTSIFKFLGLDLNTKIRKSWAMLNWINSVSKETEGTNTAVCRVASNLDRKEAARKKQCT